METVPPPPPLPPGHEPLRRLSVRPGEEVWLARGPAGPVVLRLGGSPGGRAELAVLADVDHPGLVRLLGHGHDPATGTPWVARTFVEGEPLDDWAAGRPPEEVGAVLAALLPALQHLHDRGLVHGDLKPANVLVDGAGLPHLTDFGLSGVAGASSAAGSLFFVAPEVLGGAPRGPAADLFAAGVMLHALLTGASVTAEAYYARFPAEDHFAATGTRPADLPGWARELTARLVDRDPARRPSAAGAARDLRTRLGLSAAENGEDLPLRRLRWSPLLGREEAVLAALEAAAPEALLVTPPAEDPVEVVEALRLRLALRGVPARRALPGDLERDRDDLEGCAREALDAPGASWVLVPLRPGHPADARHLVHLARSAAQRRRAAPGSVPRVLGVVAGEPEVPLSALEPLRLVPLPLPALELAVAEALGPDLTDLARSLHAACEGSVGRARRLLEARLRRGDLVPGPSGARLRPGGSPGDWDLEDEAAARLGDLDGQARELLVALELAGGDLDEVELAQLLARDPREVSETLHRLAAEQQLELSRTPTGELRARRTRRDAERLEAGLSEATCRRLHGALARHPRLARREPEATLHRYAADPSPTTRAALEEALDALDDAGRPEELLGAAETWTRLARRLAPADLARAAAAEARAWARLGQPDRAEERLDALPTDLPDAETAAVERARAAVLAARGELDRALEHLERAGDLDPGDGGAALALRALLLHRRGDLDGLEASLAEAEQRRARLAPRPAFNLATLRALLLERRGHGALAREHHAALVEAACRDGDAEREARSRLNLGLALRRSGDAEGAAHELERVVRLEEQRAQLPGLAQARAMLGSVRRSEGRLEEAAALLASARELRERLGDAVGARTAAGMLGLVQADRGALRAALDALAAAAEALAAGRRPADAAIVEARLEELRARVGAGRSSRDEEPAADPRVLLGHARAAALRGDPERAAGLARRAGDLAERLEHGAGKAEARLLLAALGREPWPSALPEELAPRARAEALVLARLRRTPDDAEPEADLELARDLAGSGLLDLAARLAARVTALATREATREAALAVARGALEEVERGLTEEEVARARATLLGLPDPCPEELEALDEALERGVTADRDLRDLLDINRRLVAREDQRSLVAEIVESALRVTRAERGFLILEEDGVLAFDVARNSSRGALEDPEELVSRSVLRRVFEGGRTVRLSDAGADPLLGSAPSIEALELRSILVAPFQVDERLRGAIYVDHRVREGAFGERAEELLELLGSQAALALRQVRRLEEIRGLNQELAGRVREREAELAQARRTLARVGGEAPVGELVGSSEAMARVRALLVRVAPAALPVLVHGESGTGKELAARALHRLGPRAGGPLVAENCAALPASLIESELFGYRKGAFTGADRDRAGIFERAHTGTLFLDEIGELPLELQAKLLRVLETREVRRLGDSRTLQTDFRLVAATNRDLAAEVEAGRFRADLYYRLDALRVELPPLAERVEDVPELVEHFLRLEAGDGAPRRASREVLCALSRRPWPGNVRELANEVARLCVLSGGDLEDPDLVRTPQGAARAPRRAGAEEIVPLAELERRAILDALRATGDDKRAAAARLGISRAKLYQRLKLWADEGAA